MYTQCPDCATVFRVTADALRAAHGNVRCGICSTTFNALEHLSEQSFEPAESGEAPAPEDTITVEEVPGSEDIELSTPPEQAEQEVAPAAAVAAMPAEVPPAEPAVAATEADENFAMEFHGDAADLDRLFVMESAQPVSFDPGVVAATLSVSEDPANDSDLDSTDEFPILVLDEQDDVPEPVEVDLPAGESIVLAAEEPASPFGSSRILIPDEMRQRLSEDAARAELSAGFGVEEPVDSRPRWPWVAGVGVMLLLFVAQVVHSQRDQLVRKPGVGPMLAEAYALVGLPLTVPTDLSAYELRQWGAANDPNEADRLLLRASIINRASHAQPFPLLRLALQDRFGATLGIRDIEPSDYLPGADAPGLLQPGERADALIRIVDPGKEAVGFEMDVCIAAGGGVRCANQITTAKQ
ncbi:MAG: DUF3426 domain-containing protein [Steroidobacteraceae bacterium]